ncbi:hypothetical protein T459_19923 [Capsicum annuum]|uniref:Uncharacterized protein n=1 Tax=Capsicum annuum TaxID=4072 RepID=A0A2G2Z3C1_CAPAN|nr:hypothetical protein T459_19923 [Capsicum annuum]
MHDPKQSHLDAALHVVRYLKGSPSLGILLSSNVDNILKIFCDSDWAFCAVTRKSVTEYCINLGQSLISWKSRKQETISRSITDAEYRSMASAVAEIVWLVGLLDKMNIKVKMPVDLFCDNKAAIQIAENLIFSERTKHIEVDCHFVRKKIQKGLINAVHVAGTE